MESVNESVLEILITNCVCYFLFHDRKHDVTVHLYLETYR